MGIWSCHSLCKGGKIGGTLTYGSHFTIHFDDRTLAHLQVAIGVKIHLGESFTLSWKSGKDGDGGRGSIWIFPSVPLFYKFTDGRWPLLNSKSVEALVLSANTPEGMMVTEEPHPVDRDSTRPDHGTSWT